jgi:hypothetical protein
LSEDRHVKKERYTWYTLKVLTDGNTISIYLDNVPKLQVRTGPSHNANITKVGIRVDHETTEFQPIKIGHISPTGDMSQKKETYYHVYYPLNGLALSKTAYDTFAYGDMSAFAHKTVILTWDPGYNDTSFRNYLDFVNNGGRLVVINTREDFSGGFSKLLNVKAGNTTKFDRIVDVDEERGTHDIAISGSATGIDLKSVNATAKSYYMNNDKKAAPFALEHEYGSSGGKIIFINSAGYFEAVFKSPKQFFMTLGRIPSILDLELAKYNNKTISNNITTDSRFTGDMKMSGRITIASPSLLLPNGIYPYRVNEFTISNESVPINGSDEKNNLKNVLIQNMTLSGSYKAFVELSGVVSLPSSISDYGYVGILFPSSIDLTVKTLDSSGKVQFMATVSNATGKYNIPFSVGNREEIRFHNLNFLNSSVANQTLIMKRPEINASGSITVSNLYTPDRVERAANLTVLNTSLDHSDIHLTNYKNVSRVQYVTYLKWIQSQRIPEDEQIPIKLPGDISERAKREGVIVPWEQVMVSKNGIILLISAISITTVVLWRLRQIMK